MPVPMIKKCMLNVYDTYLIKLFVLHVNIFNYNYLNIQRCEEKTFSNLNHSVPQPQIL